MPCLLCWWHCSFAWVPGSTRWLQRWRYTTAPYGGTEFSCDGGAYGACWSLCLCLGVPAGRPFVELSYLGTMGWSLSRPLHTFILSHLIGPHLHSFLFSICLTVSQPVTCPCLSRRGLSSPASLLSRLMCLGAACCRGGWCLQSLLSLQWEMLHSPILFCLLRCDACCIGACYSFLTCLILMEVPCILLSLLLMQCLSAVRPALPSTLYFRWLGPLLHLAFSVCGRLY